MKNIYCLLFLVNFFFGSSLFCMDWLSKQVKTVSLSVKTRNKYFNDVTNGNFDEVIEFVVSNPEGINLVSIIQKNTALIIASREGNFKIVDFFINSGANIEIKNKDGWTALMFAAQGGHTDVVKALLDADADYEVTNNEGQTAKDLAVQGGHDDVVKLLYDFANKTTTLMDAARDGDLYAVRHVLKKSKFSGKYLSNKVNSDGWTALMFAAQNGHIEVVKKLLNTGADYELTNHDGQTAKDLAVQDGHDNIVQLLDDFAIAYEKNLDDLANETTPFMAAAREGNLYAVRNYLRRKLRIKNLSNQINNKNWTALMFAAQNGHTEVVQALLDADADYELKNNEGQTAKDLAVQGGHDDVVQLLYDFPNKTTTLMNAARDGDLYAVRHVLKKSKFSGKYLSNKVNSDGWTALMFAAQNGHIEVVKKLLNTGAYYELINNEGKTAKDLAVQDGHDNIVQLLDDFAIAYEKNLDDLAKGTTPLMAAAREGNLDAVRNKLRNDWKDFPDSSVFLSEALKIKNKSNKVNSDGWTALMFAAQNGHTEVVQALLDAGADYELINDEGKKAKDLAVQDGHDDAIRLLDDFADKTTPLMAASRDGDLYAVLNKLRNYWKVFPDSPAFLSEALKIKNLSNQINSDDWTALMFAAQNGHTEVVQALLDAGADYELINNEGKKAKDLAVQGGHDDAIQVLNDFAFANEKNLDDLAKGTTPLMAAAREGNLDAVISYLRNKLPHLYATQIPKTKQLFLREVLRIKNLSNQVNSDGWTALMFAAQNGHTEVVQALLDAGADYELINNEGKTAKDLAVQDGHDNIVQVLNDFAFSNEKNLDDLAKGTTPLMAAAREGNLDTVRNKLRNAWQGFTAYSPVEVLRIKNLSNQVNSDGWTALMFAAQGGHTDVVKALLDANAEVDVQNKNGETALDLAMQNDRKEIVNLLQEVGKKQVGEQKIVEKPKSAKPSSADEKRRSWLNKVKLLYSWKFLNSALATTSSLWKSYSEKFSKMITNLRTTTE